MDRVKRYALIVLDRYPNMFTTDFETNKELLKKVARITSKSLYNEVAGYITREVKKRVAVAAEAPLAEGGA